MNALPLAAAEGEPIIRIDKLWMEYGDQIVLEDITLHIPQRAFVAIVGPSGCGKTTLLRIILGEERQTEGTVLLDGSPLVQEPGPDRGVVFQRYSVFPHLTVLQNVLLGAEFTQSKLLARLFGTKRRDAMALARTLIDEVGLTASLDKYPAALSGGMQQRLALAQALVMRPRVLLLDEPFGALDPGTRAEMHVLLRRLWHETELTVLMVTHDLSEAFSLATRVIALERPRDRPEERDRYGARIGKDIEIWPKRIAGNPSLKAGVKA
jgi:NitT/TauT family transport system ATP-binding protein